MNSAPLIAAVCLAVGLVGGCMMVDREPSTNAPRISNFTDGSIEVFIERDGSRTRTPVITIEGGRTAYLNAAFDGACTDGTLIAVGPAGDEEDRRTEPLCPGDNWSIGSPGQETQP